MTATVFAARLDGWIQLLFILVVGGAALANKILEWRRNRQEQANGPSRAAIRRRRQEQANMDPKDIDQFLDEVLTGRRARPPQPEAGVPEAEVVVLRPNRPPVRQPARQQAQPQQRSRQSARRQAQPPPAASGPPRLVTSVAPAKSDFHGEVQRAVDQAAQAASGAGALQPSTQQAQRPAEPASPAALFAMLRSPADVRRAIVLREIFGPPRALRGPKIR